MTIIELIEDWHKLVTPPLPSEPSVIYPTVIPAGAEPIPEDGVIRNLTIEIDRGAFVPSDGGGLVWQHETEDPNYPCDGS